MRTFLQHLSEVQKTYDFRVKLANIDPEKCMERLKTALETWQLREISAVKRLPIKENVIEFPSFGPTEVYQFDVSLAYPCIDAQLRQLIAERCNMLASAVYIVPTNHPEEQRRNNENSDLREYVQGESVIDKPFPEANAEQKAASKAYSGAESILKDLKQVTPANDRFTIAGNDHTVGGQAQSSYGKTSNSIAQGKDTPMTKQNKIPNPNKGLA
jgi:hypothetical protein